MSKVSAHFFVSGRVQGVFFRQATCNKAKEFSMTGWVRNLADGRVEVVASAEKVKIRELERWLRQGPPAARVTGVIREDISLEIFPDFSIRY